MSITSGPETPGDTPTFDDPTGELSEFLENYRPKCLPSALWLTIAADCIALVKRAGPANRERISQDVQVLAATGAALLERNRPVTLEEILSDAALRDLDSAAARASLAPSTRANRRAVLHRLQAHHRRLPWQVGRGPKDELATTPGSTATADIDPALKAAKTDTSGDGDAFLAIIAAAALAPKTLAAVAKMPEPVRRAAERYAAGHAISLTDTLLRNAGTEILLATTTAPVATLMSDHGLTRRDLDRALAAVAELPEVPDAAAAAALRGPSQN